MASGRKRLALYRRWLVAVVLAYPCSACATLWGFDDATTVRDAATAAAATTDADPPPDDVKTPLRDAFADAHDAVPGVAPDTGPPDECSPACLAGSTCEKAVGGESVCVNQSGTCDDTSGCAAPHCCVWLDDTSATGRCLTSASVAPTVSCLCLRGAGGPGQNTCAMCGKPPGDPGAEVMTCHSF